MDLNAQDGGNRKFIMVQLPESCDEKSEAYKAGFKTIADIGKERIRRAAAKIKAKNPEFTGDTGFQVYRLATSNRTQWKPLENPSLNLLEGILASSKQTLVDGWKTDEVVIEMMLLEGFPLDATKTKLSTIASNEIWKIIHPDIGHSLLVCLDAAIEESTTAHLQRQPKEDIFVCLDSALNDQAKLALSDALKVKTL
jgi:adenine-specific DNA-methyltransferase